MTYNATNKMINNMTYSMTYMFFANAFSFGIYTMQRITHMNSLRIPNNARPLAFFSLSIDSLREIRPFFIIKPFILPVFQETPIIMRVNPAILASISNSGLFLRAASQKQGKVSIVVKYWFGVYPKM